MAEVSNRDLAFYAALGIGAYILYRAFAPLAAGIASATSAAASGVKSATDTLTSGIAKAITAVTLPAPVTLTAPVTAGGTYKPAANVNTTIALPDGREIPFLMVAANMQPSPSADGTMQFTYQGVTYQTLGPADETNTLYTQALQ